MGKKGWREKERKRIEETRKRVSEETYKRKARK
jgi:hypothetical protein